MDTESNESRAEENQVRTRTRKRRSGGLKLRLPAFLSGLFSGRDVRWYFDVRLYSPLILLLLILALLPCGHSDQPEVIEVPVTVATEPVTEPVTEPEPINEDAAALARLADSVGAGRSDNVKTIIMWLAVNRSEAGGAEGLGLSLQEEIARPDQWQGYDENIKYSEATYEIAKQVLATVESGGLRPLDSDMLWLVLNNDGSITVRNMFANNGSQKWREKTVR